jgi:hypothetical protein
MMKFSAYWVAKPFSGAAHRVLGSFGKPADGVFRPPAPAAPLLREVCEHRGA